MNKLTANCKLSLRSWKFYFQWSLVLGVISFSANIVFGQNQLVYLADQINRGSVEEKRDALLQIRNLKTPAAAQLAVSALTDKSEIVRATAAQSVIFLSPEEAASRLTPLLRDKSVLVRKEAVHALGKTRGATVVRSLIETIQKDKVQEVKDAATVALGETGEVSAIDALTQILQRRRRAPEEFFRRAAARSIGQIALFNQQFDQTPEAKIVTPENFLPDKFKETTKPLYRNLAQAFPQFRAALSVLAQTLRDEAEFADVKRETAFALGVIGDNSAVAILTLNLANQDYYLAEICREALQKLARVAV